MRSSKRKNVYSTFEDIEDIEVVTGREIANLYQFSKISAGKFRARLG